jgi:hypothetical protein
MKKFFKGILYVVITIILLAVIAVIYITLALPNVGKPEDIKVEATPKRIARGEYLANHVTVCTDCHSKRDWTLLAAPVVPSGLGGGGEKFDESVGFPGDVWVPNITPFNLKNWTDGELFRTITTGVKKDGSPIFPLMPWPFYSKLDREDVYSIIAYVRTLKSQPGSYPSHRLDFPLNIIVHTMPQKATLGKLPDEHDTLRYGAYMVNAAACFQCHTNVDKGDPLPGMDFAGGREFGVPGGATVRSANITPDKETGIGNWTKAQFIARFRMYADSTMKPVHVNEGEFQTIMPWYAYGKMKGSDLEAIYTYLRTVKPVSNKVVKFQPKADKTAALIR